jgi:ATP-dependent RNA helicase RhlB
MNEPEKLTVETDNVTADRVRQIVYFPAKEEKQPLLINLLSRVDAHRSIVFVNTKIAAEKVTRSLERQGFTVATLSGDVPQAKRERLLGKFQKGEIEILVATDVAARGLHIPDVSHVFNYDLPHDAEDYVHRIGRTARLGAEGDAISFACDLYAMGLPDIESYIEQKIPTAPITPDLLVVPPPRPRAAGAAAPAIEDDEAADDARNTAGPPPKPGKPARGPRAHGERERSGSRSGPSRGPRGEHGRSERPAAAKPVVKDAPPVAASPRPDAAAGVLDGEAPRKRRRRGGRGRNKHREGVETATNGASQNNGQRGAPAQRIVERKPHPHAAAAPAAGTASTQPPKQGFFRRIMRMFGPRS